MKKIRLLLSSLILIPFLTNCNSNGNKFYTVIWKNDDGTVLERDNNVPHGAMPSYDHSAPSKPSTDEFSYVFSGWDHELTEVTSNQTYIAKYTSAINTYTIIWQNDDETEIQRNTDVEYGSIPSDFKPADPSKPEDEKGKYSFAGWDNDTTQKVTSNITFKAVYDTTHKYSVSIGATDKLKFETTDGKPINTVRAYENEDFVFKMKVDNTSSNPVDYVVPSTLSVVIEGIGELSEGVSIVKEEPYQEATVTIDGSKITNDIIISGKAVSSGEYAYTVSSCYGLIPIKDGTTTAGKETILAFAKIDESLSLPKAENIYVYFDKDDKWISPAEKDVDEYCSYDEDLGRLTIEPTHIISNVDVKARAYGYPLLEALEWDEINRLSLSGNAPYLFYIGEEKTVKVDGTIDQKVRIIDFNHDELATSTPEKPQFAGITFEFVNTINNSGTPWNDKYLEESTNFDFINGSTLNGYLKPNGAIYNKMPLDLMEYVKFVTKHVEISTDEGLTYVDTTYNQQLFPLSCDEMHGEHILTQACYEYYKEDKSDKRKKDTHYWLRSPQTTNKSAAYYITYKGGCVTTSIYENLAIAPAFCI